MAEFLTVNLGNVLKNQKAYTDIDPVERQENTAPRQERDLSHISDWAKELKDRLAENKALEANERQSDYEIEAQFFEDYFNNANKLWDEACAEQLISLGEPLKKAIKILGFNHRTNPILGFIINSYVINNLIKTKLLNVNTFKAIYNAVSKKLVAHTEFMKANDSNIIYCQDLYRRSAAEMEKYLNIQSKILKPSASEYTEEDIEKNKKVFFYHKAIKEHGTLDALPAGASLHSAKSSGTKMNSLDFASTLAGASNKSTSSTTDSGNSASTASSLARKITSGNGNTSAQAFAAIQYLSATTDIPEVKAALKYEAFKAIPMEAFIVASANVTKIMKEADLPDAEVKSFISLLLGRL